MKITGTMRFKSINIQIEKDGAWTKGFLIYNIGNEEKRIIVTQDMQVLEEVWNYYADREYNITAHFTE